jgi:hypothetical protein
MDPTRATQERTTVTGPLRLDPQQGLVRVVRAGVLTVPAVGFATFAHGSVDGCVSVVAVLLAVGVCWPAAVVLLGAQRRLPTLVGWLVVAQGVGLPQVHCTAGVGTGVRRPRGLWEAGAPPRRGSPELLAG